MATHNAENERIKRRYVDWLKETQGFSEASLDHAHSGEGGQSFHLKADSDSGRRRTAIR
jgi:hypothetical protein